MVLYSPGLHGFCPVALRRGLEHALEQLQLPGGKAGRKAHRPEEFEQAWLGGHSGNAVRSPLGQIAVHEAEKLPAVALAARPGVGGQGVDIPARGGSAAGQGQRLGQQGQHGGQPPLLHHLKNVG